MIITSSQNSRIKMVRSLLAERKEREQNQLYVVEGVRLAEEAISAAIKPQFALFSNQLSGRGFEIVEMLKQQSVDVEEVDTDLLGRISDTRSSQGILLVLDIPEESPRTDNHNILVLDQISDPGNLGTLLRSAAGFGFNTVITTPGSVDAYSPKVVRSAMGAHFKCSLLVRDAEGVKEFCKVVNNPPLKIILAEAQAERGCWELDLSLPLSLVIGNEADGPSPAMRSIVDEMVAIPINFGTESLNAAVSGSILMYEIYRQRNKP
jgi:TrmH family RNA methyltransferase